MLQQNWNCSVNLTFFSLPCLIIMFDYLMKEAYFFNCGENLSAKGMTYLTNSLFDYRSPENNSIRAEFILDVAHHKVRELLFFFQKYFLMLSNEFLMIFGCVLLEDWFTYLVMFDWILLCRWPKNDKPICVPKKKATKTCPKEISKPLLSWKLNLMPLFSKMLTTKHPQRKKTQRYDRNASKRSSLLTYTCLNQTNN